MDTESGTMPLQEVVLAIVIQGTQALIVKRTKQEIGKNNAILTWGFPGGKIEPGESKEAAVLREAREETGYQILVDKEISERVHPDFPIHVSYFLCSLTGSSAEKVHDQGTSEVRWVNRADVASYMTSRLDPHVIDLLETKS